MNTVRQLIVEAEKLLDTRHAKNAAPLLEEALRREPESRDAARTYARLLTDTLGRPAEALEILTKLEAAQSQYDIADVNFQKAQALHSLERNAEAVAAWDLCLKHMPDIADAPIRSIAWLNRASCLKTIDLAAALESSEIAIELDALQAGAWYNRSCYEALHGQVERACRSLRVAIALDRKFEADSAVDPDFDGCRTAIAAVRAKKLTKKERRTFGSQAKEVERWRSFVGADRRRAIDTLIDECP